MIVVSSHLRPWLWCFFWLGIIWLMLAWLVDTVQPIEVDYYRSYSKPTGFTSLSDKKCANVLALGDSLLERSVPDMALLHMSLGDSVCLTSISKGGGTASEFISLEEIRPSTQFIYDVLYVQDGLLVKRPENNFNIKAKVLLKKLILKMMTNTSSKNMEEKVLPSTPPTRLLSKKEANIRVSRMNSVYLESIPLSSESMIFLKQLKSIAKKVVVIDLPRSKALSTGLPQKDWLEYLDNQLSTIDIELVVLGESLPDDHYFDGSHVNEKGQAIRVQQFSQLIGRHL